MHTNFCSVLVACTGWRWTTKIGSRPYDGEDTQIPSTVKETKTRAKDLIPTRGSTLLFTSVFTFAYYCMCQKLTTIGHAHFTETAKTTLCCDYVRIFNSLTLAVLLLNTIRNILPVLPFAERRCRTTHWPADQKPVHTTANLALVSKGSLAFDPDWNSCSCHTPPRWLPHTTKVALLSSPDTRTRGCVGTRFIKELGAWLRAEQVFDPPCLSARSLRVCGDGCLNWCALESGCTTGVQPHPSPTVQLTCPEAG